MIQAQDLEKAGCFSIVLECVPNALAEKITQKLTIPTIGIGAGINTDGQVLVLQDMLGFNTDFKPRFVRHFLNGAELMRQALEDYHQSVASGSFPNIKESYE